MKAWFENAGKGRGDNRINNDIHSSLSRNRITVSMMYIPHGKRVEQKVKL